MTTERSKAWSWTNDVLPLVFMLLITCLDMTVMTIVKAAMNDGMKSIVYIVYHNALGTLILLPFFVIHIFRNGGVPPLTFHIVFRFFILGLLGLCGFQILLYVGVNYSSPTLASAITNLLPGITFLLAVIFRMEKIDIRSSSTRAKLLGTVIAISGAMVFTIYRGPEIIHMNPSPDSPNQILLSHPSTWVFGGLIVLIAVVLGSIWNILQSTTVKEYQDQPTIVFFYCLFGTISCIALSLFLKHDPSAWVVQPGIQMIAIVCGAVFSTAFRSTAATWCLQKKGPVFVSMFTPLSIVIAVIMGVTFLGDSLLLGSAIGAAIVAVGFYTVLWGQAKEKSTLLMVMERDTDVADEPGSLNHSVPLLSSVNE
uniref:WAT1-related protein At5g40240-like n=1 Tax=Erigeron canadensis TaxID=72917 RepID=UPI001CB89923|nr:WAT1-related protein At5g40240-like [Erigeron canadensis]